MVRLWVLAPRLPGSPSCCQVSKPCIPPHHKGWKVPQSYKLLLLCCPARTLLDATSWQQHSANIAADPHQFGQVGTMVQESLNRAVVKSHRVVL